MYLYAATVFTPELQDERPLRLVLHRDLYNRTLLNIKTIKPEPSQNKSFSVRDVLSVICSVSNYKLRWFTFVLHATLPDLSRVEHLEL